MEIRFLDKTEYAGTTGLFTACFGEDAEFMEEFYGSCDADGKCGGVISDGLIAAAVDNGSFIAMVQVIFKTARYMAEDCDAAQTSEAELKAGLQQEQANTVSAENVDAAEKKAAAAESTAFRVPYIMGVCTLPEYRHRGIMDSLMNMVMARLKEEGYPWCFLIAVNRDIYRHLDYVHDWKLNSSECELLYADDGLDTASGRLLNADTIGDVRIF